MAVPESPRLNAVNRYWMLRAAHTEASRTKLRNVPLWSFVGRICCVGSTSANQICRELGWNPDAPAMKELP